MTGAFSGSRERSGDLDLHDDPIQVSTMTRFTQLSVRRFKPGEAARIKLARNNNLKET